MPLSEQMAALLIQLWQPRPGQRRDYAAPLEDAIGQMKIHLDGDRDELIAGVAGGLLKASNQDAGESALWPVAGELATLLVDWAASEGAGSASQITHRAPDLLEGVAFAARHRLMRRPGPKPGARASHPAGSRRVSLTTTVDSATYTYLMGQGRPAGEVIDAAVLALQDTLLNAPAGPPAEGT